MKCLGNYRNFSSFGPLEEGSGSCGRWQTADFDVPRVALAKGAAGAHVLLKNGDEDVCLHMVEVTRAMRDESKGESAMKAPSSQSPGLPGPDRRTFALPG